MPFTVSHIAAVVPAYRPLSRQRLFSAAVIGSMVPDFGLLLPGGFSRWQTHSLPALLSFCLPVGLLAYALTQWLIRPAMLEVLPDRICARLQGQDTAHGALRWLGVPLALLFGALTHLVWDGFTHENARGVRLFPQLLDYGPQMAGHSLRLYRWLQYGSSVAGLAVVAASLALWLSHASRQPPANRRLAATERHGWLAAYVSLPVAGLAWFALRSLTLHAAGSSPAWELERAAVVSLRATVMSLVLVSALIRLRLAA